MSLHRLNLLGSSNIGNYILSTNNYFLITGETKTSDLNQINDVLKVDGFKSYLRDCRILSPFMVGNSKGLVISSFLSSGVINDLKNNLKNIKITVIKENHSAIGNLVLVNDKGGLCSQFISKENIKILEKTLEIKIETGTIGEADYVGSLAVTNNSGCIVSPYVTDIEINQLESILKTEVKRGTINSGSPYISSGLILNDYGIITSRNTDGSELMNISQAFQDLTYM